MSNNPEFILKITNPSYDDFNGFEVKFIGFEKAPYPFWMNGWPGGKYLLKSLQSKFGKFTLIISKEGKSNIYHVNNAVEVVMNFDDAMQLIRNLWQQNKYCAEKSVHQSLSAIFPEEYPDEVKYVLELPEEIRGILPSRESLEKATSFLHRFRKYSLGEQTSLQLKTSRNILQNINLENVLNKFEEKLKEDLLESDWQTFFENNLLVLNPGYIKLIPKANIAAVSGELPDFLLISVEGFVDVYEIKLPKTELLVFDNNHNTYYWSSDITKAIAQTEKYISTLDSNRDSLEKKIGAKYKLKLTILRPRGYVIAGSSTQLKDNEKNNFFRLLNESLRNTRIMPYDTFLNNFENLSQTLLEIS
jgi:hypothetical protein